MSTVVDFKQYHCLAPSIVFVDMFEEELEVIATSNASRVAPLLANCRKLLSCARAKAWPIGFVRPSLAPGGHRAQRWIDGFKPQRADMVFDRTDGSCYSSAAFASAMDGAGGVFVLAGFCAESTGLPTFIDAFRRDHGSGFIYDASASRPFGGFDAALSHRAITALASQYTAVVTTMRWIGLTQRAAQKAGP